MSWKARLVFNAPVGALGAALVAFGDAPTSGWATLALVIGNFIGYFEGRYVEWWRS